MTTKDELLESWRSVREAFKLDGHKLSAEEAAGMLIEQCYIAYCYRSFTQMREQNVVV